MPLTAKQTSFIQYYADPTSETHNNATQSAIKAGYSPKTASNNATQIMSNHGVSEGIRVYKAEIVEKADVTRSEVIDNARYLIDMGKTAKNGTDIGKGNEQLAKIAGVFSEKRVIEEQTAPVSDEERIIVEKAARELNIKLSNTGS